MPEYTVTLRRPHEKQETFILSPAKRKVIKAGRRGGKTTGVATLAIRRFLDGQRVLYAAPTEQQVESFWFETKRALKEPLESGVLYKNESLHVIEVKGSKQRIKAKTAFNADSLRGDHADLLILDEWQLMNESAWEDVGAPMLLDNDGDAVFVLTPPSLRSRSVSKARDPRHAAKMYKKYVDGHDPRWETFHFTSHDNPHISKDALAEIAKDMTSLAYRQEILGEDIEDDPNALWKRENILRCPIPEKLESLVVAIDPAGSFGGDETGIVVVGMSAKKIYVLEDASGHYSPEGWASRAIGLYEKWEANKIIAEKNFGGDMVLSTLRTVDPRAFSGCV